MNYLEKKQRHSKLDNLVYTELKMQNYLQTETVKPKAARTIFSYRTRMSNYSENYRGKSEVTMCPICQIHIDSQKYSFQCPKIKENVEIHGEYSNIFSDKIQENTLTTVINIIKI